MCFWFTGYGPGTATPHYVLRLRHTTWLDRRALNQQSFWAAIPLPESDKVRGVATLAILEGSTYLAVIETLGFLLMKKGPASKPYSKSSYTYRSIGLGFIRPKTKRP